MGDTTNHDVNHDDPDGCDNGDEGDNDCAGADDDADDDDHDCHGVEQG